MVFDDERKKVFLEKLRETLNASASARAAGVSKRTVFGHREKDPGFAQAWEDALEEGLDAAEQSCNLRAFVGVEEPVFHQGVVVGHVRRYSDSLAQFMLKANRPKKFRESVDLNVKGELTLVDRILAGRRRVGG
jgi:hypothetical protein